MREGLKDDRYNLRMPPPEQLVPRELRLGVRERMRADGRVEMPLDHGSLDAAIAALERAGRGGGGDLLPARLARSAATSARPPRRCAPPCPASTSRSRPRCCRRSRSTTASRTTVVNAYVGPALARYLHRLGTRLREAGYRGPVLIIQSHGGVATDRRGRAAGRRRRALGPGRRRRRQPLRGAAARTAATSFRSTWAAPSTDISPGRRRRAGAGRRTAASPANAWRCRASTSSASAPAAARSRASTPAASCMSGPQSAGAAAGPGLLRPRRHRGDRDRRQPRARAISIPTISSAASARLDRARRRDGGRPRWPRGSVSTAWPRPKASIASSTPTWPRASGSSRCAAASIRGASRCCRSAAPPALHVTDVARQLDLTRVVVPRARGGAFGVGHAGDRPALRGGAHAYRRCQPPRWRRRSTRAVRRDGGRGTPRGCAPRRSTGRCACSARPTCATASRSSRSPCRSTASTGHAATRCRQIVERIPRAGTRNSTPTRCATRRRCWSMRASR